MTRTLTEQVSSETGIMVEAVVGPSSSLISKSLSDAHFRSRYNLTILAIHRKGKKRYNSAKRHKVKGK